MSQDARQRNDRASVLTREERSMSGWTLAAVLGGILLKGSASAETGPAGPPKTETGTIRFQPLGDQRDIPERYRLEAHTFPYEMTRKRDLPISGLGIYEVHFPSPVKSPCPENNTVYAEYYRPRGKGPFPGVIVLDITGGDQSLSRAISAQLAQHHIAALFVQMAYYGPRRPAGSKLRLLSTDYPRTVEAIRQTVLDVRRATAWLAARPEVDAERLGIHGTSLGSMIGALAAEMEPRLRRVSIALGGGGLVEAYYNHPRAAPYRKMWEALGGSKEQVMKLFAPVDPITCAARLKDRRVLMIGAKHDQVVPPRATEALWTAAGKPRILWYDCNHYSAALYFAPILKEVVEHFAAN
jgi:dienelactone hydrolase